MDEGTSSADQQKKGSSPDTLGAVLYAGDSSKLVPEASWARLVRRVAAREVPALRALVEASYRIVYTLAARITTSRESAELVTVNLFHDVWQQARRYDADSATVVAWIMNRTRARAFERLQLDMHGGRVQARPMAEANTFSALSSDIMALDRLWNQVEQRIGLKDEAGSPPPGTWPEPDWEEVAPNISCKLLANDLDRQRVSMVVRLAPGGDYPPHRHAGLEELHLLHGELWIDDRKLVPGDYNRAQAGTSDKRVWSETGCTCVLITSTQDDLAPSPEAQPE